MRLLSLGLAAAVLLAPALCAGATFWERLGLGKPRHTNAAQAAGLTSLSEEQIAQGLKEALGQGVQQAVRLLGRDGGFLNDLSVKILMPDKLQRAETILRRVGQGQVVDEFITTMNRAAERAVPEAAGVLKDAITQMTLADAKAIVTGPTNAATQYLRRTSETNLFDKFLPIVRKATDEVGVTRSYKRLIEKAGFAATLFGSDSTDLDSYITRKALDGFFLKIAEEEGRIRANPATRTTELLRKVFGAVRK